MVFIHLATGFEEVEALTAADLLRRANVEAVLISMTGQPMVEGAHGLKIETDMIFEDADYSRCEMIVLPGGMPGTKGLEAHSGLCDKIREFDSKDKFIAAICAAPMILGGLGLLEGRKATIYPGMENFLKGAIHSKERVAVDGNIITSMGPGTAMDFGIALVEIICGKTAAENLREDLIFNI